MTEPAILHDVASMVLGCICDQMDAYADDTYPGCPCRVHVSPGAPAYDDCCDWDCPKGTSHGQLTAHIEDVFATDAFPDRATPVLPCAPQVLVAQTIITVVRCTPTLSETGRPPTAEAIDASSRILYTDLAATIQALSCCVPADPVPGKRKRRVAIQNAGTVGAAQGGGCASAIARALIEVGAVCNCETGS